MPRPAFANYPGFGRLGPPLIRFSGMRLRRFTRTADRSPRNAGRGKAGCLRQYRKELRTRVN